MILSFYGRPFFFIYEVEHMKKIIRRGDIFYADLNPIVGSEQGGHVRPCVIIQNNLGNLHSPTVIVAAITSRGAHKQILPTHASLSGAGLLKDNSIVLLEQIRTIDKSRLRERMGKVDEGLMNRVDNAIAVSFGITAEE
jgi:mRNA interferase MazF